MSVRFLADESFDGYVIQGARERRPDLDLVRAQDVGLMAAADRAILEWAAQERRVVLTRDIRTMLPLAVERVRQGESMPGLFATRGKYGIGAVIEDLLTIDELSQQGEWEGQVHYLPL